MNAPLALILAGAGIVLIFAAYRGVSPVALVTETLGRSTPTGTAAGAGGGGGGSRRWR